MNETETKSKPLTQPEILRLTEIRKMQEKAPVVEPQPKLQTKAQLAKAKMLNRGVAK